MLHEPGGLDVTTLALRRLRKHQSGTTAVEFAVVLPLLLMLIFGIIEFGRAMVTYSTVVTASREAARYGSTVGATAGVPNYHDCKGMRAAADRLNIMAKGAQVKIWFDTVPSTGKFECTSDTAPSITPPIGPGHRVTVEVSQPFELMIPVPNFWSQFSISAIDHRTIGGKATP
jgi:Flp pilus assembly protein TadG